MTSHRGTMDSPTQEGSIRKRVCKACDRCRLKKSKCDGANPCSRCKTDNAICVFGERKKSHDKVYPKGYVEMLEQQQHQLVAGLRELYRRLQTGEGWLGEPLREAHSGHPLTHGILERLDLLHVPNDSTHQYEGPFEEDPSVLQQRLIEKGAKPAHRRGSVSSQSDHGLTSSSSSQGSPQSTTKDSFPVNGAPPTPPNQSPFPRQSSLNLPTKIPPTFSMPPYIQSGRTAPDPMQLLQPSWAIDTPVFDDFSGTGYPTQFDSPMSFDAPSLAFDSFQGQGTINPMAMDWSDSNELDFSNFVTIST